MSLIEQIANGSRTGEPPELQVRIFRLICATTAVLCVFLIAPSNAFLDLPLKVDIANLMLGAAGAVFYWQSIRNRHFTLAFVMLLVALLDVVWFWNAGSQGSITLFFFPVLPVVIALFQGWRRLALALGLALNVCLLFLAEHYFPHWVAPFQSPLDRLLDLETGIVCSFAAVGSSVWLILVSHDRERHRVTEIATRLAASEQNYREIFNSTSDALFLHAGGLSVLDANEGACAMFGHDRPALLRLTVNDISLGESPYSQKEATEKAELALAGKNQVFEWRSKRANGELFWSEIALHAWESDGIKRVVASVRDISERKKTEQQYRYNEERLRLAMVASKQGWFELNVQTGEGISSPEYVAILGFSSDEFVTGFQGWIAGIHPDEREMVARIFKECARSGETSTVEYRRQTKACEWKWIRSVGKIVEYDAAGKPLRMSGTHMDITERKELEAQLLHSQRLEAVGTLASGVAHDLNNVLTPMLMAAGILRDKLLDPYDRSLVTMIDESGKRGAAIVRQLLVFSRDLVQDRAPVDLRRMLEEMTQLMRSTFPKEITVQEAVDDGAHVVEAEQNQLHQVLMNLCVNARDAMPKGGLITLGLTRVDLPTGPEAGNGAAAGGPYEVLSVADNGEGIPAHIIDRIFDPFFTTKVVGKGTGLGLASVHGIVKAHHGFVRVESTPERGTIFRVFLPASESAGARGSSGPETKTVPRALGKPLTNSGAILLVDDDPAVLYVTSRMLEVQGYRVIPAASGAEALQTLHARRDEVALVITDFSMPEMDGPTLAPLLREMVPHLRIVGVSGLSHERQGAQLKELGFSEVLRKPYEFDELIGAVRRHFPEKRENN